MSWQEKISERRSFQAEISLLTVETLNRDDLGKFSIYHKLYRNENLQELISDVNQLQVFQKGVKLYMTGGGAYKFKDEIEVNLK